MSELDLLNKEYNIQSIYIVKNNNRIDIFPWNYPGNYVVEFFEITESIHSSSISGHILFRDMFDWSNELNIHSFEKIVFEYKNSSNIIKSTEFKIYSVMQVSNRRDDTRQNQDEIYNSLRFDFTTDTLNVENLESEIIPYGKDFVGYIATENNNGEIKGLVNQIFSKLDITEYEIEPTLNGIWIKSNEVGYPWGKSKGQLQINRLFQYICNYAVSKENANAVNYFLWRDMDGYHFKSLEKMITDSEEEIEIFFTQEKSSENSIQDIKAMEESNIFDLSKNNTFQAFYERMMPNYDDFYLDFVDSGMSYKTKIVDFNYHRDFSSFKAIENYKLIPDTTNTNTFIQLGNDKSYIQSIRTDDNFYGYYEKSKLNSPFTQSWEYLGKTGDSRWNDVNFIPQFDITDLSIETFYTIHKKIREPLIEKRKKLSRLKNIKKKWEVYRCSVCCLTDQQGGTADDALIASLRNLPNPTQNPDYNFYFGITGIFGSSDGFENPEYKIAAAGSFSDVFNYDENQGANKGLTLSWDENNIPYNKMHDFYALETGNGTDIGDGPQLYINNVFDNGIKTYDKFIEFFQKQLTICDEFLNDSQSYISAADSYLASILEDTQSGSSNNENTTYTVEFPYYNVQAPTNRTFVATTDFLFNKSEDGSECLEEEGDCDIPCNGVINKFQLNNSQTLKLADKIFECSKSKILGFRNISSNNPNSQGFIVTKPVPNDKPNISQECLDSFNINELYENWNYNTVLFTDYQFLQDFFGDQDAAAYLTVAGNFSLYNYYTNKTDKDFNPITSFDISPLIQKIQSKLAICFICLDPIRLEILERNVKAHKARCSIYLKYFEHMKNNIQTNFIPKWKQYYKEYQNRKVYFISKKEDKIINNSAINSELSLFNIKSIQRKPIRGSRYEILSRKKGITGSEVGPYLYKIFFNDDETKDISVSGNHPYYDQALKIDDNASEYKTFYPIKNIEKQFKVENFYSTQIKPFDTIYNPTAITQVASPRKFFTRTNSFYDKNYTQESGLRYANYYLNLLHDKNISLQNESLNNDYRFRYNFYKLQDTKIPSQLKREVLTSYVRVEFKNPIGLDSVVDFPDGFIRNAGFEYFLPYLVSLTSGPNGRQTIRQNAVVIGMDPYGFDIAMKRIPDNIKNGRNYWWNSGMEFPGMDLWPEVAFETQYPYYRTWDFDSEFSYNDGEKYGSIDSNSMNQLNNDHFSERAELLSGKVDRSNSSINSNGSRYDPTLINTKNNSNYNFNTSKYLKVHRNWWSFHHPQNIIIIPSIFSNESRVFFGNKKLSSDFIDSIYNDTFYYWGLYNNNSDNQFKEDEFDRELKFTNKFFDDIVSPVNNEDVDILKPENSDDRNISAFKNNAKFEEIHPEIKAYFSSITNWWLSGDNIMYRPGLLTTDVWKYDISGYSEYGMVFPPIHQNHPDIFDNNFAAQFIVFARNQKSQNNICEKLNLKCVNPNGSQNSNGCPDTDPYCNCPAKNRMPMESEPSYLEIYELEQETKECALIEENLGPEWLGCVWSNDQNTASCNCPEIGDKFMDYLEYSRTYATFWNTPDKTPLLRNSQMNLLRSNECIVEIKRNDKIKVGSLIKIVDKNPDDQYLEQNRRFAGRWLVSEIEHKYMNGMDEYMVLVLNRDSLPKDPNQSKNPRILQ